MNCKHCGAELDEGVSLCPVCGEENAERTKQVAPAAQEEVLETVEVAEEISVEAAAEELPEVTEEDVTEEAVTEEEIPAKKKPKVWLIVLAAIAGVAILAVLAVAIMYGLGVDLKPRANDVMYKENYSVEAEEAPENTDTVVATVGDKKLTNGELQVHYWMSVIDFLNNYGYYLTSIGLDYTQPLNEQVYDAETGMTWQQFFLDNALSSWHRYAALDLQAQEDAFVLDAEMQQTLDDMPQQLEELATENGFASAQEMLTEDFGSVATIDGYLRYMADYYTGLSYFDTKYEGMIPTQEEIETYFTENEASLAQNGITKVKTYYNVRHILIKPEGGTLSEDGNTTTYTDEEWAACLASAQALLDQWKNGEATEDSFAALATEHSEDPGSATEGGLYTQLTDTTNFVEEFKAWYLDETRVVGDTGLVKSFHGYHIMYFSGMEETEDDTWSTAVSNQMVQERSVQFIEECMEKFPMDVKYKKIVLGEISLAG